MLVGWVLDFTRDHLVFAFCHLAVSGIINKSKGTNCHANGLALNSRSSGVCFFLVILEFSMGWITRAKLQVPY